MATKDDGDAVADFVDVGEVLHYLDEAENRADDTDGGSETTGRFEDLGFGFPVMLVEGDVDLDHLAEVLKIGAVDGEHERLL